MKIVSAQIAKDKIVLLRLDLDVPLRQAQGHGQLEIADDFRLKASLPTLNLCLENALEVIIIGHIGRPDGVEMPELSVAPIYEWLEKQGYSGELGNGKIKLLENLRFEKGESQDRDEMMKYAHSILDLVDPQNHGDMVFVNDAFAAYHPSASTTVLPKLLPHFTGKQFAEEIKKLTEVRNNPKRPLVAIIGGVKLEDKGLAIEALSRFANTVLVGGKLASNITLNSTIVAHNVIVGKLNEAGDDLTQDTLDLWEGIIKGAGQIIWNGPVGKVTNEVSHPERPQGVEGSNLGSAQGTYKLAKIILASGADFLVGGGDTVGFLGKLGLLGEFEKRGFVSTGGGAMLKFLVEGTLPTIQALE